MHWLGNMFELSNQGPAGERKKKKADHILVCTEAGMISILFSFGCFYEEKIEERVKKRKGEVTWERGVAN